MTLREIQRARAKLAREIHRLTDAADALRTQDRQFAAMEADLVRLHSVNTGSTVDSGMETEHRLAIAKSRSSDEDAKFVAACQKARHNATTLAAACDVTKSAFSRYRAGTRPAPLAVRRTVKELIGWPESAWPKLGD